MQRGGVADVRPAELRSLVRPHSLVLWRFKIQCQTLALGAKTEYGSQTGLPIRPKDAVPERNNQSISPVRWEPQEAAQTALQPYCLLLLSPLE